jgi:hypothetical protein
MKSFKILFVLVIGLIALHTSANAQLIRKSGKISCPLSKDEQVILFPSSETTHGYYCLPTQLRLSTNEDKQPEFLLMLWGGEDETTINNGIMHWLVTWGLTKEQEKKVADFLIAKVDSNAVLLGTVQVSAPEKYIFSGTNAPLIKLLQKALESGGSIPTTAGGKSASAFRFRGDDALEIQKKTKDSEKWRDVSIEMPFFDLNGEELCTLKLDINNLWKDALTCIDCFITPEK